MSNTPFFSVIIPTLNEEKYLPTILKSLGAQTYRNFEVIIVDANSRDKTGEIVKKFKEEVQNLVIILSQKANVGYQRNLGAEKAKGTYLVFFDADVNISQTFLEELHVEAIKKSFPLATTWIEPDSEKSADQVMLLIANLGVELAKGVNKPFAGGYDTIVKNEVFNKMNGFREDMTIGEDHDFVLRAYKKNIELTILKEPRLTMSLRRFRSEGTLRVLRKYTQAQIYALIKGPITKELFEYKMGGHAHGPKTKRSKIKNYLKYINQLQKKLTNLLKEL